MCANDVSGGKRRLRKTKMQRKPLQRGKIKRKKRENTIERENEGAAPLNKQKKRGKSLLR